MILRSQNGIFTRIARNVQTARISFEPCPMKESQIWLVAVELHALTELYYSDYGLDYSIKMFVS